MFRFDKGSRESGNSNFDKLLSYFIKRLIIRCNQMQQYQTRKSLQSFK